MTNRRNPFRFNVGFIVHEDIGFSHEFQLEFKEVAIGEDLTLYNFNGILNVGRTTQGLLCTGGFIAQAVLECVRCLKSFNQYLKWQLTELYSFPEKAGADAELILPEDLYLDLRPVFRDYALLEIPMNPICKTDCKGLCPVCGEDLNLRDCGHRPDDESSPFSNLKDMLKI
jgi:uncharacterized protein